MQASNAPAKIQTPFANAGAKQVIPVASQIGISDGRASYTDGFPPLTRTPVVAGGVPPFGTDMNGILNAITAIQQWQNAGWFPQYDSTFSAAVGGYPKNAILQKADSTGLWISTADNNTTNPDTGGAGWVDLLRGATAGTDTGVANAYVVAYTPAITALADLTILRFTATNANTAASTLKVNGLAAKPLLTAGQSALVGGEIIAGSRCEVIYSSALDSFILILASGGSLTSGRLIGVQVFTSSGTYTPTPGTKSVIVEGVGGGAAGGGTQATNSTQNAIGQSGSGGSYGKGRFTSGFSGVTVTIGAGGTASTGAAGGNGGTTSFGALLSIPGGVGGVAGVPFTSTNPSAASSVSGGSLPSGANIDAQSGGASALGLAISGIVISGVGGSSRMGNGAAGIGLNNNGVAATESGGGGSGACASISSSTRPGGNGAAGKLIVWEYA